jgi:hypothetical protein
LGLAPQSTIARYKNSVRLTDEARFKGMEETRQTALEVAEEKDAPPEETAQTKKAVRPSTTYPVGAWGSQVSLRAPVNITFTFTGTDVG